jgi:hypothetical protein
MKTGMTDVSKDSATIAGEPLTYLATPNPEITSSIVTIPPGTTTDWMAVVMQSGFSRTFDDKASYTRGQATTAKPAKRAEQEAGYGQGASPQRVKGKHRKDVGGGAKILRASVRHPGRCDLRRPVRYNEVEATRTTLLHGVEV